MLRLTPPASLTASGCAPPIPPRPAVTVMVRLSVPPKCLSGRTGKRLVGALQDALGADVDPASGGHLAVHHQPGLIELVEGLPVGPVRHQVGVGDQHARRERVGLQHRHRLAGLHQQGLVVFQAVEDLHDLVKALPIAGRLAAPAVDDQVFGVLGHLGVEVVHQHAFGGFLNPAFGGALRSTRSANLGGGGHGSVWPAAVQAGSRAVSSHAGQVDSEGADPQ